jgi:GTP-binding protein
MFVDEVEIQVESGKGGDGCMSFRREKFAPRGGPDGGDGGNGGSVIILAQQGVDSLSATAHRKHWKAKNGNPGEGAKRHGASADDLIICVPPGTIVGDSSRDFVLKDLAAEGDQLIVARGGRGGKGNVRFKSSTNRSPRQSTPGGDPETRRIRLELKIIADVGLVGKPNAGKSTLLSRLSRARPEIAPYPFTTKYPNLGRVQVDFDRTFIMADIPGLIEGAHAGVGLGHEFLRHIQRAGILVHLIEPEPLDGTDPISNYTGIRGELVKYDEQLGERPEIVAVTKADLPSAEEVRQQHTDHTGAEVLLISDVSGEGLNKLVGRIDQKLFVRDA